MPAASPALAPLETQLLAQLGERLRKARVARGMTAVDAAKQVGISRMTLRSVEAGDSSPTMGTYLRVMSAMGCAGDLVMVGAGESEPSRAELGWEAEDVRNLAVHREAFRLMQLRQEKLDEAIALLEGSSSELVLDELLPSILIGEYQRLLEMSPWATGLRRLSPLDKLVPKKRRTELIARELEAAKRLRRLKPQIDKALKGLTEKGVKAELVGSAAWGGFQPASDVDVLVIDRAGLSEGSIQGIVAEQIPGAKVDVLFLDAMEAKSQEFILKQMARHGRAPIEGAPP